MVYNKLVKKNVTIAFYNVENLFDIKNNPVKHDNDFLPNSEKRWTKNRYQKKLNKLSDAISKIGYEESQDPPAIIGIAEAENKSVLLDLINTHPLSNYNYDVIHYDSKDERGIDVGLIFNKDVFKVENSKAYSIYLEKKVGIQDHTRDILYVSGYLNGELVHCLVNHWPSRREGVGESSHSRMIASQKVLDIINSIKTAEKNPKIIVMGDFNDNPNNDSVKNLTVKGELFNPMKTLVSFSRGTLNHRFKWNMFDQILFSTNFFETDITKLKYERADIFDNTFLKQNKGKYKGHPLRTYAGSKYIGGYSDHFPIYLILGKMRQ